MRSKPSLQDISYKLSDLSSLVENLADLCCQECNADLDVNENDVYCSDCVEADRSKIEDLENEVKARAEVADALERENKELKEKLERADWSDKMDLLHEWAIDLDSAMYKLSCAETVRQYWYQKHTALFNKMMGLQDEIKKLVTVGY